VPVASPLPELLEDWQPVVITAHSLAIDQAGPQPERVEMARGPASGPGNPMTQMLLATRFIEPCLPSTAERPPSGPNWTHEIKHDGYRLMACRDTGGVRLLTRKGHDWASH
jgi:ATP-dependent DNA ligase